MLEDITPEDRHACLRVLESLVEQPELCLHPDSEFTEIRRNAAALSKAIKRRLKAETQARDQEAVQQTGLRQSRRDRRIAEQRLSLNESVAQPDTAIHLASSRNCYVCKVDHEHTHSFYDMMCPGCGEFNFHKRKQRADLAGRTALLTGGRVKIGFQIGLKLLQSGASLIVTSRFPVDALVRYSKEPDFNKWKRRLRIYGVDFRHLPGLEQFTQQVRDEYPSLDILINNSAQTIRRPPAFYEHVWKEEQDVLARFSSDHRRLLGNVEAFAKSQSALTESTSGSALGLLDRLKHNSHISAALSQVPLLPDDHQRDDFPVGQLDEHGQQVDLRAHNSWVARVSDVSFVELLEVHAVNTFAPFYILQKLEPLLMAQQDRDRFVVNVSAMEGRFDHFKDGRHPHTNMAKAALNMLTRTCGEDYARQRLYMNSVDTGWVTNEFPHAKVSAMQGDGFEPPLDEIDGAARVLDPVFDAMNGCKPFYGKFLKDYRPISW